MENDPNASPPPDAPPQPLDYAKLRNDKFAGPLFLGVVSGVIAVCIIGFVVALLVESWNHEKWNFHSLVTATAFWLSSISCLVLFFRRRNRLSCNWYVLGLLLGIAAMALIEGYCFTGSP